MNPIENNFILDGRNEIIKCLFGGVDELFEKDK
jgi:hypothetical protein